jgi:hypothetical protein
VRADTIMVVLTVCVCVPFSGVVYQHVQALQGLQDVGGQHLGAAQGEPHWSHLAVPRAGHRDVHLCSGHDFLLLRGLGLPDIGLLCVRHPDHHR